MLGDRFQPGHQVFPLVIGKEYKVYGIDTSPRSVWVLIETDLGYLVSVPLLLFTVIDPRIPPGWVIEVGPPCELSIMPPELLDPYFLDDLSEGIPEVRHTFERVRLEAERFDLTS
jgi:hypothetical protein